MYGKMAAVSPARQTAYKGFGNESIAVQTIQSILARCYVVARVYKVL